MSKNRLSSVGGRFVVLCARGYAGRRRSQMLSMADDAERADRQHPARCMSEWKLTAGDALAPGRRIVRRLGGGTAHEAFLVEVGGCRAVAKVPRHHLAGDPHCLLRLRNEGRALRRLAHRAVPRHLGTVLLGPHPHLLLEHVSGPTPCAALRPRTPLPGSSV